MPQQDERDAYSRKMPQQQDSYDEYSGKQSQQQDGYGANSGKTRKEKIIEEKMANMTLREQTLYCIKSHVDDVPPTAAIIKKFNMGLVVIEILLVCAGIGIEIEYQQSQIQYCKALLNESTHLGLIDSAPVYNITHWGDQNLHTAEVNLGYTSLAILSYFLLTDVVQVGCDPLKLLDWTDKETLLLIFDMLIIAVSMTLELYFSESTRSEASMLILARSWRFVRFAYGYGHVSDHSDEGALGHGAASTSLHDVTATRIEQRQAAGLAAHFSLGGPSLASHFAAGTPMRPHPHAQPIRAGAVEGALFASSPAARSPASPPSHMLLLLAAVSSFCSSLLPLRRKPRGSSEPGMTKPEVLRILRIAQASLGPGKDKQVMAGQLAEVARWVDLQK